MGNHIVDGSVSDNKRDTMRFEHKKFIYHTFGIFNATLVALGTTVYANSHMDTELTVNYIILRMKRITGI